MWVKSRLSLSVRFWHKADIDEAERSENTRNGSRTGYSDERFARHAATRRRPNARKQIAADTR
jgi:hypothetical protein